MADIFLSYSRADYAKAAQLAKALQTKGWSVYWDIELMAGQRFHAVIEAEIAKAAGMIVAWSTTSITSDWVIDEANIGREAGTLIPILFDNVKPPIGFRSLHNESFINWNGDIDSHELNKLHRALQARVGRVPETNAVSTTSDSISLKPSAPSKTPPAKSKTITKQTFIEPEMVIIPAGSFQMGGRINSDEQPVHTVTLAKPFALGKYPVTFAEYDSYAAVAGVKKPDDEGWGRDLRPVINVSWDEALTYARWLAEQTGQAYRLPTEAEWEYAVRAGTSGEYYWGSKNAKDFAWFTENANSQTQVVGGKQPNDFGLYDMAGNVWEWLQDNWHDNYEQAPNDGSAWMNGNDARRVVRGGSWFSKQPGLRSANRDGYVPVDRYLNLGFRLAQD